LAKLVIIIYFSVWLNSKREQLSNVTFGLIPMGIILGILIGLIMLNPDISVAITVLVLGGLMFYLADGDARQMFTLIIIALILGYLVITVLQRGSTRWETYLKGLSDPSTADTQIQFAIQSLVNGGLFGVGIGRGVIKHFLPVAWTDSIFAVIVEETGLLGGITIFGLYMVILWRGLTITNNAKDQLGKLLAGGITIWLTGEALVNMLVMANMLPVAGNALPFVSYGGTTIIVAMTAIGLLLNVGLRSSTDATNSEGRSYGAAVDLRWRDGRRRQSRSRRPGSYRE
jgi:cell division protein FtsW